MSATADLTSMALWTCRRAYVPACSKNLGSPSRFWDKRWWCLRQWSRRVFMVAAMPMSSTYSDNHEAAALLSAVNRVDFVPIIQRSRWCRGCAGSIRHPPSWAQAARRRSYNSPVRFQRVDGSWEIMLKHTSSTRTPHFRAMSAQKRLVLVAGGYLLLAFLSRPDVSVAFSNAHSRAWGFSVITLNAVANTGWGDLLIPGAFGWQCRLESCVVSCWCNRYSARYWLSFQGCAFAPGFPCGRGSHTGSGCYSYGGDSLVRGGMRSHVGCRRSPLFPIFLFTNACYIFSKFFFF